MRFDNLELVKEYPNWFLNKTKALRVYRTSEKDKYGKVLSYRYHIGYPEEFIKPFCPLIETTPFWGEQHWTEIDGFWLWWTVIVTKDNKYPINELNKDNLFRRNSFARCLEFLQKG